MSNLIDPALEARNGGRKVDPCPFCGGTASLEPDGLRSYVSCDNDGCFAEGPEGGAEEAIAAWNTRSPPAQAEASTLPGEVVAWMIRSTETKIPFWGFQQNHFATEAAAAKAARCLYAYEPFPLYASAPLMPTQTITADELGEIMQDEWGDICEDAQAHPSDIRRDGRKLFYDPRHWTAAIADRLNARAQATPPTTPAVESGEELGPLWRAVHAVHSRAMSEGHSGGQYRADMIAALSRPAVESESADRDA